MARAADVPMETFDPFALDDAVKPEWFVGVHEAQLSTALGLSQFGVNMVILEPGAYSALRHWHEGEDEFVYVLSGELTLIDSGGASRLPAGAIAGFPAGERNGHHLTNRSSKPATYLVVGSRRPGQDVVHYPDDGVGPVRR